MEVGDGADYALLFFGGQLRENWKRQNFFGRALGLRQIPFEISKISEAALQVQRDGVVNLRRDVAVGEELAEIVATFDSNDVLMEDVSGLWESREETHRPGALVGESRGTMISEAGFVKQLIVTR